MRAGDRDPLLDAWDNARVQLVKSDSNLWRCKELLLEWVALHEDPSPIDFDWLSRIDRLYLETRTVLLQLPDVVHIPTSVGGGEAAGHPGSLRGTATDGTNDLTGRRHLPRSTSGEGRTLADDVNDGLHDEPHP